MDQVDSVRQCWKRGIEPDLRELFPGDTGRGGGDTARDQHLREQQLVDAICEDMRWRWAGDGAAKKNTDDYLRELAEDLDLNDRASLARILACEWAIRRKLGDDFVLGELHKRHPGVAAALASAIAESDYFQQLSVDQRDAILSAAVPKLSDHQDGGDGESVYQTIDPAATQTHAPQSGGTLSTVASGQAGTSRPAANSSGPQLAADANPTRLGRYQVVRKLGSGAFGDVFLGYDEKLDRHVAIKTPRRQWLERTGDVEIFLSEARAAAGLNHPGIVTTHDIVEESDGTILIVMEYIDGGNLQDLFDQQANDRSMIQALGTRFIASVGYQTALALAEAHHHGLIHRDLKPANLMVKEEQIRITDFGLAIQAKDTAGQSQMAGTPAYMSPEQVESNIEGLDARSDVWSLGVILYQLSTGQLPFQGSVQEIFQRIKNEKPQRPRLIDKKIPAQLEAVILRCLEKNREERFDNVLQVADELRPLAAPSVPGFRWEYIALPLGVALSFIGTAVGLSYTSLLIAFESFFSTGDLVSFGVESFLFVALTLGVGPPLVAIGNWFCCRRCKALSINAPTIPCRVSRWAIGCIAAGVASAGFGLPMYAFAVVLGIVASLSIRRRKRWLTGYRHIAAGLVLGALLVIPWTFYWWAFGRIYPTVAERESFDRAVAAGDFPAAESSLETLMQLSTEFPVSYKGGERLAMIYEARLKLARGDHAAAIELANNATNAFFLNASVRICGEIVRAAAYRDAGMELELASEKIALSGSLYPYQTRLPAWAIELLDELGPIEPPEQNFFWGETEEVAPAPPAPLVDPSA